MADIRIGQVAAFTGPVAAGVNEITRGAKLHFDSVNASGGIHGRPVVLVSVDDEFDPEKTRLRAQELIEKEKVLALFLTRGTPHTQAVAPLLETHQIPLVGPSTGAMSLHRPVNRWIFNVRSTYQREASKAIEHLTTIGMNRIGILATDDSFGEDVLQGALATLDKSGLKPAVVVKFPRARADFDQLGKALADSSSQAFLVIGSAQNTVGILHAARRNGSKAQAVTLSNNASAGFVEALGEQGRGTIITQVFPNERSIKYPLVKKALEQARADRLESVSPAMLEGYVAAMVLTEGLRIAGPNPTSAGLRDALERLHRFDIGGMEISYSENDHTGLDFVDLSIIDASGRFRR